MHIDASRLKTGGLKIKKSNSLSALSNHLIRKIKTDIWVDNGMRLTAFRNCSRENAPLSCLSTHDLIHTSFWMLRFFLGRRIWIPRRISRVTTFQRWGRQLNLTHYQLGTEVYACSRPVIFRVLHFPVIEFFGGPSFSGPANSAHLSITQLVSYKIINKINSNTSQNHHR